MHKLLLIFTLWTGFWADKYPKSIVGKWGAEDVQLGDAAKNMPQQQKDMMLMMAMAMFATATLEFKADHSVNITADMPNVPKGGKWEYDASKGLITVTGAPNKEGKPQILLITATERSGQIFFQIAKTPMVLTMVRKK
ncbi:hypothetical protein [Mucilaginibacter myungsuensis]|uniref:Lipocalin-like domain-containing protein n=1 Tax=Mucilaginibacter myungsuensis TaxID=649104 RepID=A0A929L449_9SPHI|nr:hypothetical protein [Mucilaginibacter myungsuensis]MBE9662881.1 hypothetical protein [Mucilaginibacter myungsuensis]MDN3598301.1 hypothetical protein [Mucilaginibacter myungsuensis]